MSCSGWRGAAGSCASRCAGPTSALFLKPLGDVGQITPVDREYARRRVGRVPPWPAPMPSSTWSASSHERGRQTLRRRACRGRAAGRRGRRARPARRGSCTCRRSAPIRTRRPTMRAPRRPARRRCARPFPTATIVRPSIVFGPEDDFFNRFAGMARCLPALPLIGGGKTRFQPVYVGDVAEARAAAARGRRRPPARPTSSAGRGLQLPRADGADAARDRPRAGCCCRCPSGSRVCRPRSLELPSSLMPPLPVPPLTRDQVRLLSATTWSAAGARASPSSASRRPPLEAILPTYLERYRPGGRFVTGQQPA